MMSRQDGYNPRRHLMSTIETDIDTPERQSPPSPAPLLLSKIAKYSLEEEARSEEINGLEDNPPQTPYYDYACNNPVLGRQLMADEKSKQQVESKQVYVPSYGPTAPGSPSNSMHSILNLSPRPVTGHHMSPGHALPTGMANMERSETMPEIQMPSMATLDPFFSGTTEQDYTSIIYYYECADFRPSSCHYRRYCTNISWSSTLS